MSPEIPSTGVWAALMPQVPNPHLPPLCSQLLVWTSRAVARASCMDGVCAENKPVSAGMGETTNLSSFATFGKQKMLLSAELVSCEVKRRYTDLRILLQEGARCVEQMCSYKSRESTRIKTGQTKSIFHLKAASRH